MVRKPANPLPDPEMLMALPEVPGPWVGARRPIEPPLKDGSRVDACVWIDTEGGIRTISFVPRDAAPHALSDALRTAMDAPMPGLSPSRPRQLALDESAAKDETLWTLMDAMSIEAVHDTDMSPLDVFVEYMKSQMKMGKQLDYLRRSGVDTETVGRFFAASSRYAKARPWVIIGDHDLVRIEGLDPSPLYVSVLGRADVVQGAAIYLTPQAATAIMGGRLAEEGLDRVPMLHFELTDEEEGTIFVRAQAGARGWEVPPRGHIPLLLRVDRAEDGSLPDPRELDLASQVLEVIVRLRLTPSRGRVTSMKLQNGRTVEAEWPLSEAMASAMM